MRFSVLSARRIAAISTFVVVIGISGNARPGPPPASGAAARPNDHVPEIESAIKTLLGNHALKESAIGIAILDVDTGHYLAALNEHLPLNPASNAKLYTASAALALLGPAHRYETSLAAGGNGPREGAVSSLVLRGHGDPSLTSSDLWSMVQELKAHGVRRVDGDLWVDQAFFDDQTTPPAFEQQPNEWAPFRAPVAAVSVNENPITLSVRPGPLGAQALATFEPPGFVDAEGSVQTAESGGADNVMLTLSPNGKRLDAKLSGTVSADAKLVRYTRRVDDPTLLAGYTLRTLLERADVKVSGEVKLGAPKSSVVLVKHESEPLAKLLYSLGKNSDNFYAEMIFKSLGGEMKSRPAKSADGAELVSRWLEKAGALDTGVVIKNGSGLFDSDRATAASFVELLRTAWLDPAIAPEFVSQLAIGGVDGTLHKRFRDDRTHRSIRAKTGTLEDTVALTGYVLGTAGKGPIAFSILMNHAPLAQGRAAMDTIAELLARRQEASAK